MNRPFIKQKNLVLLLARLHAPGLQARVSVAFPGQAWLPPVTVWLEHVRERVSSPAPHDTLQDPQALHALHTLFTDKKNVLIA